MDRLRILIAEDEQRARRGLKDLILSLSDTYEVVAEIADGKQALEIMHVVKPDIVFTDLKMPYMSGLELIKAAKAAEFKVKFVIISAYEEFEVARQAISLGVSEYLVKPIMRDEVKDLLERLADEKSGGHSCNACVGSLKDRYPDAHPLVRKSLSFIEAGYASKISQKELAENLGVSQEYLCYLFNKDVGMNFSPFIRAYRIDMAKKLLLSDAVPKEDIPYQVGFSDSKYFHKVFREIAGISVADFLKQNGR